jgi:hypothetical protein
MSKEKVFWNWFRKKSKIYSEINELNDENKINKLLDSLLKHLHDYSEGLFFQIGGDNAVNELIISADGNKNYFTTVENLVDSAPKIRHWKIIAFKPPQGSDFVTKYKNAILNPKEIWFLPFDNDDIVQLGLRFYIPNFAQKDKDDYINGMYQVLDTILGEKACALDIDYVDVDNLPACPEAEGLIELVELPDYINWRKSQKHN